MKLKTELHVTTVLHIEVPHSIDSAEFEADINVAVQDGLAVNLKNGINVGVERFHDCFDLTQDGDLDELHETVEPFLRAVLELPTVADEYFFHR